MERHGYLEASEQRRHPRFAVRCPVRLLVGKRQYAGYLQNLSQSGARIATLSSLRDTGAVVLRAPDLPPLRGRLCWSDGHGGGVSFHLNIEREMLATWAANRLGWDSSTVRSPASTTDAGAAT